MLASRVAPGGKSKVSPCQWSTSGAGPACVPPRQASNTHVDLSSDEGRDFVSISVDECDFHFHSVPVRVLLCMAPLLEHKYTHLISSLWSVFVCNAPLMPQPVSKCFGYISRLTAHKRVIPEDSLLVTSSTLFA